MRWHFDTACPAALRASLASGSWRSSATLIKQNAKRRVFRVAVPASEVISFLKENRRKGLRDWLKAPFRHKSRREFESLQLLRQRGVPAVKPLAWGQSLTGGTLVTEAWENGQPFATAVSAVLGQPEGGRFFADLGAFLRRLFAQDVVHGDLHGDNILVRSAGAGFEFALLDTGWLTFSSQMASHEMVQQLGWLAGYLKKARQPVVAGFLDALGGLEGITADEFPARVKAAAYRSRRKRLWGYRRRLLGAGSLCTRLEDGQGKWLVLPSMNPHLAAALLQRFTAHGTGVQILKQARRRTVARLCEGGASYVLKCYRRHPLLPAFLGNDRQSWLNTGSLDYLGFPVGRAVAWCRTAKGDGVIIFEDAGQHCLYDALGTVDADEQRRLCGRTGRLVAQLHEHGIYHRDLKTSNFVIAPPSADGGMRHVRLVDCDRVAFRRPLSLRLRRRNLVQLLEVLPRGGAADLGHAILGAYLEHATLAARQRERLCRELREGGWSA